MSARVTTSMPAAVAQNPRAAAGNQGIRWVAEAGLLLRESHRLLLALATPAIPDRADEQAALALAERIEKITRRAPT